MSKRTAGSFILSVDLTRRGLGKGGTVVGFRAGRRRGVGRRGSKFFAQDAQDFAYGPGLRDAPARLVGHVAVKNFGDRPQTRFPQMREQKRQVRADVRLRLGRFPVHFLIRR